jgi:hypothetical protein
MPAGTKDEGAEAATKFHHTACSHVARGFGQEKAKNERVDAMRVVCSDDFRSRRNEIGGPSDFDSPHLKPDKKPREPFGKDLTSFGRRVRQIAATTARLRVTP